MKPDRIKINKSKPNMVLRGRINVDHVDATTRVDIAKQIYEDDIEAMFDAAKYARSSPHHNSRKIPVYGCNHAQAHDP